MPAPSAISGKLINIEFSMFFDKNKVVLAMDKKVQWVLARTAGYAAKHMRGSMKRRKSVSKPNQFPSAHAGQLKELIRFGFTEEKTTVVGPLLFNTKGGDKTVPELINEGGSVKGVSFARRVGRGKKARFIRTRKTARHTYKPRPFVALTQPVAQRILEKNMKEKAL